MSRVDVFVGVSRERRYFRHVRRVTGVWSEVLGSLPAVPVALLVGPNLGPLFLVAFFPRLRQRLIINSK